MAVYGRCVGMLGLGMKEAKGWPMSGVFQINKTRLALKVPRDLRKPIRCGAQPPAEGVENLDIFVKHAGQQSSQAGGEDLILRQVGGAVGHRVADAEQAEGIGRRGGGKVRRTHGLIVDGVAAEETHDVLMRLRKIAAVGVGLIEQRMGEAEDGAEDDFGDEDEHQQQGKTAAPTNSPTALLRLGIDVHELRWFAFHNSFPEVLPACINPFYQQAKVSRM